MSSCRNYTCCGIAVAIGLIAGLAALILQLTGIIPLDTAFVIFAVIAALSLALLLAALPFFAYLRDDCPQRTCLCRGAFCAYTALVTSFIVGLLSLIISFIFPIIVPVLLFLAVGAAAVVIASAVISIYCLIRRCS